MSRREKYFIVVEGSDKAIIRSDEFQVKKTVDRMQKSSNGRKIHVWKAVEKIL